MLERRCSRPEQSLLAPTAEVLDARADMLLSAGVLLPNVVTRERISPEGYGVTEDEKRYLRRLCDDPKDAHELANELADDSSVPDSHRTEAVADRLTYLTRYDGTEHLIKRDGGRYRLTEDGRAIFC